ncbi:hypothetical protein [Aurantiacibacter rhizosphaerae]|uniref:Uncharacterized protein n=1 Tax=Aurantiacibacter rhizosphaerae TaxID=2691582 RepID=A0A844XEI8_9SPHN|nr:hypothetical protein [Aurantiacibacter rhizosphaerae]MWV28163.1 hypothetical protein [Aurantiacibacter rhizosphaerae]
MIIRLTLAASLALAIAACVTPQATATDCGGESCVAIGDAFDTGSATITPLEVLEDSRCPTDAQCVWAGQLRIRALVERDGREREMELTHGTPTPALSGNVVLTQVWPVQKAEAATITPEAYRFAFSWTPIMLDVQR